MSYAAVASHHTSGPQPHPDTALLNTAPGHTGLPDVDAKVTVVPQSFKEHPVTATSVNAPPVETYEEEYHPSGGDSAQRRKDKAKRKLHEAEEEGKRKFHQAEEEGSQLWAATKQRILQPGVMGGLMGVVNVGLIGAFGYHLYTKPHARQDARFLSTAAVSALVLFGGEGYIAEQYHNTPEGREEERRAREEGAYYYNKTKNIVLKPGVLGGLVGVVNVGILGGVGYLAYEHWDMPHWDRRTVSAVSVGLLSLFAAEGFLGEEYKEKEYPKRKGT